MIIRSNVTRVCPECGDPIQPGDYYDDRTGECVSCIQMDDVSVGYNGAWITPKK